MSLARLIAAFAVILSVSAGLSACGSVPEPAPGAAPPPASDKGDDAPETENNPL